MDLGLRTVNIALFKRKVKNYKNQMQKQKKQH